MIFIRTNYIVPPGYGAISIYPLVFIRPEVDTPTLRNHENIHGKQIEELLWGPFYALYAVFYIWGLLKYRNHQRAYRQNPFEQEAYAYENHPRHLYDRGWYHWRRFTV